MHPMSNQPLSEFQSNPLQTIKYWEKKKEWAVGIQAQNTHLTNKQQAGRKQGAPMHQSDFQMRNMRGQKKNKLKATDDKSPTSINK